MVNKLKQKVTNKVRVFIGTAVFVFSFAAVAVTFAAWAPPTAAPPGNNAAEPINVSGTAQTKAGNFGIGTSAPGSDELRLSSEHPQIKFQDNTSGHTDYWIHNNSDRLYFLPDRDSNGSWETPYPLVLYNSNVGIRTASPGAALDVNGDMFLQGGDLYANDNLNVRLDRTGGNNRYFAIRNNGGAWRFLVYENGSTYIDGNYFRLRGSSPNYVIQDTGSRGNAIITLARGSDAKDRAYIRYSTGVDWYVGQLYRCGGTTHHFNISRAGYINNCSSSHTPELQINTNRNVYANYGLYGRGNAVVTYIVFRQHGSGGNDGSVCPSGYEVRGVPGTGELALTGTSNHAHLCMLRAH